MVNIASATDFWTVAEMRLRFQGRELPRSPAWRLSASPNGWEVPARLRQQLRHPLVHLGSHCPASRAFRWNSRPRSVSTRWSWNATLPGTPACRWKSCWTPAAGSPSPTRRKSSNPTFRSGIRRAATRDLKALGFRFLLVNEGDMVYEDMKKYPSFWGITQLAEANGTHFYRID